MHPKPSQFKIKLLKPLKMVKFPASCAQAVGFSSDMYFFKEKKASRVREERKGNVPNLWI